MTSRRGARWLTSLSLAGMLTFGATSAQAWYFPEHVELTRLALRDFAPHFVSEEIDKVLIDAKAEGLVVCGESIMSLNSTPSSWDRAKCVPYGALAALAADHANDADELRRELKDTMWRLWPGPQVPLALLLTEASQANWAEFQSNAPPEVLRIWTMEVSRLPGALQQMPATVNPRDYVRTLDAELLAIDPKYVSRAAGAKTHFHDPTAPLETTLEEASKGDLDNGLAQLMAHHIRSIRLAVESRKTTLTSDQQRARRVEALLEHAFALHFMEDGLAAGHIATDPAVTVDERRAQRHDYFNRQGLAVTRAATGRRCNELEVGDQSMGLFPCWTAHGDGFATAADRLYVGEAAARLQTAFALALRGGVDPAWIAAEVAKPECRTWLADQGEPGVGCDLAWTTFLVDPQPDWARRSCTPQPPLSTTAWATQVMTRFTGALKWLEKRAIPPRANAGKATPQGRFDPITGRRLDVIDPETLGRPIGPSGMCEQYAEDAPSTLLWRPVLMAWPEAQTDVTTLEGGDSFGRGWDTQILASIGASYSDPGGDGQAISGWGGVGAGLAYSTRNVFPHRKTRALIELNAGGAIGTLAAGDGPRFRMLGVAELRIPATTLLLYGTSYMTSSRYPLWLMGDRINIGIMGARVYASLDDRGMRLYGWDAELMDIVLGDTGQVTAAARSGFLDNELRLRTGIRSRNPAVPLRSFFGGAWIVSLEVNSGFFSSVLK